MNFRKPFILSIIISVLAFFFISCQAEVTLTLQKDDSVDIRFDGGAGAAFAKMISSAAGVGNQNAPSNEMLIDTDAVSYELAKAGFSNVNVNQKQGGAVSIAMSDKTQTSYIFSSQIVKADKGRLIAAITRKSLEDFYNSSDEQTRMILDLFISPVFNNEEMTEDEYLVMVGSFYVENAANEVAESLVKINLISKDGTKETLNIPFTHLMCGIF